MKNNNTLCVAEWQSFSADSIYEILQNKAKAKRIFEEFKEFAQSEGNHQFLKFKKQDTLVAQNYVGLIQSKNGFSLEILPKTFRSKNENLGFKEESDDKIQDAKNLLLKMLQTLKSSPFKQSNIANLKAQKLPLLEIFVLMFLQELESLVKKGIKSAYKIEQSNKTFLKGKLLFNENLKHNLTHKERFFTQSDEFSQNIAQNRLIVSTLSMLSKRNFSHKIGVKILQMRFIFGEIPLSENLERDFAKCHNSRHFKGYENILAWCEIFLKKEAPSIYQGTHKCFALLFDMNVLFEGFVAYHCKKELGYALKTQPCEKYFITTDKDDKFLLKPDIVGYEKNSDKDSAPLFIADTKWKILDFNEANFGISQADLYQIFAYLTKYNCEKGFLIYPKIEDSYEAQDKIFRFKAFKDSKNFTLEILFFDVIECDLVNSPNLALKKSD